MNLQTISRAAVLGLLLPLTAADAHNGRLGLSIARKSIELLGGTITAKSTLGEGTTYTLRVSDFRAEHVA